MKNNSPSDFSFYVYGDEWDIAFCGSMLDEQKTHHAEMIRNPDYDEAASKEGMGDWLRFPYIVKFSPVNNKITIDNQVDLAKIVISALQEANCKVIVEADFEDLINAS